MTPPTKIPTSPLSGSHATCFSLLHLIVITATVTELSVKRVWYRTLAGIRRTFSGSATPKTSTARPSYSTRLPVEILEIITVHLTYDRRSLLACSLTCYSWHIVTVPHLHHTLITQHMTGKEIANSCGPNCSGTYTILGCFPWSKSSTSAGQASLTSLYFPQNGSAGAPYVTSPP